MAIKYTSDPTSTNPYGIGAQEQNVALSQKLIAERKANEAQLIAEQAKYSRQEQKRLEGEAVAAAARGDPDAAAKAATAKQYADAKASVAADLEQNGRLLQETEIGLQENQAVLARMQATQASTPPNTKIVNAGTDTSANNPPAPATATLNETTPASSSPVTGADPFSVTPRTLGPATSATDTVSQSNSPYASQRAQQNAQIEPPPTPDAGTVSQGNSPYASQRAQQNAQIEPPPTPTTDTVSQGNSPYASQRAQQNAQIEPPPTPVAETIDQGNSPYASQRAQQQTGVPESTPPAVDQGNSPYASQRAQQNAQIEPPPTPDPDPVPQSNSPYASQRAQQNEQIAATPTPEPEPVPQGNSPYASQRAQQNQQIEAAAPQSPDQSDAETARLARQEAVAADAPAPVSQGNSPYASQRAQQNEQIAAANPAPVDPANDPNQSAAESARLARGGADAAANAATAENNALAAAGAALKQKAQDEGAVQAQFQAPANGDWRVRLRLAPGAKYLYMDDNNTLLKPLKASNGVVFPYMPTIQTTYNADYESTELTHSNYRGQFYKSSYVGDVSITGTFTAQDTAEANYLLAVIHFFRSVTKMFYGAKDPLRGAPPPLVYLIGLGQYQFNNQPCVVKAFNYSMPNDCDYIRTKPNNYNTNLGGRSPKPQAANDPVSSVVNRLKNALLPQGAVPAVPAQGLLEMQSVTNIADATYVPTKCEIQLTLMPIQTRSQQSQQFSMEAFANGNLLKGGFW